MHPAADKQLTYLSILNSISDIVVISTFQGKILFTNQLAREEFGYESGEMEKMDIMELMVEEDRLRANHSTKARASGKNIGYKEYTALRKDGSTFPIEVAGTSFSNPEGERTIVYTSRNITQRKLAKKLLIESEQRWKYALEAANDGVYDWNIPANQVYHSPGWLEMLGYEGLEKNTEIDTWRDLIHPEDLAEVEKGLIDYLEGKKDSYRQIYRMKHSSGEYLWILDRGKILARGTNGCPVRMVGTHADLTNQVKIEAELLKLISDKDRLYSIVAHDLKNPISGVSGTLKLIQENYADFSADEIRELIRESSDCMEGISGLLENLLQWASVGRSKLEFNPVLLNIKQLTLEVLESQKSLLLRKELSVEIDLSAETQILADENMIKTILRNLIGNAIKYSNRGAKILVRETQSEKEYQLHIQDFGVGMEEDTMSNFWKVQANASRPGTEKEKGHGFGLRICKEFIDIHKARLLIKSELGKGSTFSVVFSK